MEDYHCKLAVTSAANSSLSSVAGFHPSSLLYSLHSYLNYDKVLASHQAFALSVSTHLEPTSFQTFVTFPEWRQAMAKEIEAFELNNTWIVCSLPAGHTPIDCKWVYKVKFQADGSVERHKARLFSFVPN